MPKPAASRRPDLFAAPAAANAPTTPTGLRYHPNLITAAEERRLADWLSTAPFKPFDFHGYLANRRVVGFGWRYDYSRRVVEAAAPIPPELATLREQIAAFTGIAAESFEQVLINEYRPGAGIGWHRDKPQFGEVVGVSLLAPCTLRFRRRAGEGWERASIIAEPRSAYWLTGPARQEWEHSIPPLDALRYSITFRTLAAA